MKRKWIVLRTDSVIPEHEKLTTASAWQTGERSAEKLTTAIEEADDVDANKLRADGKTAAMAPADTLLHLIEPKSRGDAGTNLELKEAGTLKMPSGLLAVGAHTSPYSGQGVTVAVLDTGIDKNHPAFAGTQLAVKNFTGEGSGPADVDDADGHGTHCAGTIAGKTVDNVRVGVAPGITKLCIGKVLGQHGGTLDMLVDGMLWAVNNQHAKVVSMSLGYDLPGMVARLENDYGYRTELAAQKAMRMQSDISQTISTLRAFLQARSPTVVFLGATGNESERPEFVLDAGLPASELLPVGAVGQTDAGWEVASFSNSRARVVGPGVDVVSAAAGGGWAVMSGTSMATPHAAGVAALWAEKQGANALPGEIQDRLTASAKRDNIIGPVSETGTGLVQAPQ